MTETFTSHNLPNGYRADWYADRVELYEPMAGGYRYKVLWAKLETYVPAWGTRRDTVTEWHLYLGGEFSDVTHDLADPAEIEAWMLAYL